MAEAIDRFWLAHKAMVQVCTDLEPVEEQHLELQSKRKTSMRNQFVPMWVKEDISAQEVLSSINDALASAAKITGMRGVGGHRS